MAVEEEMEADLVDAAWSARRAGVRSADVGAAFGTEAAALADLAARLAPPSSPPRPPTELVTRIEGRLVEAFDRRVVPVARPARPARWSWRPLGRLQELVVVGGVALALAAGALAMSSGLAGDPTRPPTVAAATETVVAATPQASVTALPLSHRRAAPAPGRRRAPGARPAEGSAPSPEPTLDAHDRAVQPGSGWIGRLGRRAAPLADTLVDEQQPDALVVRRDARADAIELQI
jgi:hypothetical protein